MIEVLGAGALMMFVIGVFAHWMAVKRKMDQQERGDKS